LLKTDLKGILGEQELKTALHYSAHHFSTVVFENNNGKLVAKKLPWEAQLSTVNGIIVKDFDGDGKKDILLAGNKFDVEVETTPADASVGVFLKGLGNMQFKSYKPMESGFFAPYNVKDIVPVNWNGSSAILMTSNNDQLRVFAAKQK
jgi:hypothetical protein